MNSQNEIKSESESENYLFASWQAFKHLLEDYHWFTKALTVFLVICCLLGIADAYFGPELLAHWVGLLNWSSIQKTLISDSFRMLLTLIIALLIGISIKRRQAQGLLDGDEHYNIGRALAYGYFKNFLVGALIVAKQHKQILRVFKPESVQDLRRFEDEVWPTLLPAQYSKPFEISSGANLPRKPLKRRIIVVQTASLEGKIEIWLDFPTTLFTIGDYYESWNRWLSKNDRPSVEPVRLNKFEQTQINEFFRHLKILMEDDIGLNAVEEYGLTMEEMRTLAIERLQLLSLEKLITLLKVRTAPK